MEDYIRLARSYARREFPGMGITLVAILFFVIFIVSCGRLTQENGPKTGSNEGKAYRMEKEYRLNRVLEIRHDPERNCVQITTDKSGKLCLDTSQWTGDHFEVLFSSMSQNQPIVIRFNPETRQGDWVSYGDMDFIVFVGDPRESGESIRVAPMTSATPLVLRKDHPRFNELYGLLTEAYAKWRKGVKAALAVPGGTCYDIMDVILIEPAPVDRQRGK